MIDKFIKTIVTHWFTNTQQKRKICSATIIPLALRTEDATATRAIIIIIAELSDRTTATRASTSGASSSTQTIWPASSAQLANLSSLRRPGAIGSSWNNHHKFPHGKLNLRSKPPNSNQTCIYQPNSQLQVVIVRIGSFRRSMSLLIAVSISRIWREC